MWTRVRRHLERPHARCALRLQAPAEQQPLVGVGAVAMSVCNSHWRTPRTAWTPPTDRPLKSWFCTKTHSVGPSASSQCTSGMFGRLQPLRRAHQVRPSSSSTADRCTGCPVSKAAPNPRPSHVRTEIAAADPDRADSSTNEVPVRAVPRMTSGRSHRRRRPALRCAVRVVDDTEAVAQRVDELSVHEIRVHRR